MLNRRWTVLAVMSAAALSFSLSAAEVTRTIQVDISGNGPFAIENLAGSFHVVEGTGSSVTAVATIHAETEALADAVRFERVSLPVGRETYRVRYPYDRVKAFRYPKSKMAEGEPAGWLSSLFGWSNHTTTYDGRQVRVESSSGSLLYADVEVTVPRRSLDGRFANAVGRLDARGLEGTLKFDTGSGSIALESLSGVVETGAGSGDLNAKSLRGELKAAAGSGDITIDGFDGESVRCDVGSGQILLKSVHATKLRAATGSGDVQASDVNVVTFQASTGSGDIDAAHVVAESFDADTGSGVVLLQGGGIELSKISADTGSGDVTLRLGSDASFEAVASQGSGDIVNRFSDAQPIVKNRELIGYRRGDGRVKIHVGTGSGNLVLEPGGSRSAI